MGRGGPVGLQGRNRRKTDAQPQSPPGVACVLGVRQGSWLPDPHQVWGFQQLRGPFVPYLFCLLGGGIQISIPFGAEIPAWLPTSPPGGLRPASCTLSPGPTQSVQSTQDAPAAHFPRDPLPHLHAWTCTHTTWPCRSVPPHTHSCTHCGPL